MSTALLLLLGGGVLIVWHMLESPGAVRPHPGRVFSPYGMRGARMHHGADYEANEGDPIRSPWDGRVVRVQTREEWARRAPGPGRDAGAYAEIAHPALGVMTRHLHGDRIDVVPGQMVRAGDVIGTIGRTGVETSRTHLHFEVRVLEPDGRSYGASIDPARFNLYTRAES